MQTSHWIFLLAALLLTVSCREDEQPTSLPPTLTLGEATDITRTTARLNGEVVPNGDGSVRWIRFRYGITPEMNEEAVCPSEELKATAHLSGLQPGTTYHYCLEAGNEQSQVRSETLTFTTQPNVEPTLGELALLNQGPLSITLEYTILDDGGEDITVTGFYYYKQGATDEQRMDLQTTGADRLSARISGLQRETDYCIQAFAANTIGETRSEVYRFRTGQAVVLTQAGTLPDAMDEQEKYQFPSLNIAGPLNGTDIRYLREIMGIDINGNETPGRLQALNLNDASIVAGGISYDGQRYTADNTVSRGMFTGCSWLEELTLPAGTTTVEENAFKNCRSLSVLHFSPQLTEFAPSAGCSGLTAFDVPSANPAFCSADGILYNKEMTTLLWYPEGKANVTCAVPSTVTAIGEYAFRNSRLQGIDLPASLKDIGQGAFAASALESVVLPDAVSLIPNGCFQRCERLVSLTLGTAASYVSEYCLDGCSSLQHLYVKAADFPPVCQEEAFAGAEQLFESCTLHVPSGCKSIYRNHRIWGQFKQLVEESGL